MSEGLHLTLVIAGFPGFLDDPRYTIDSERCPVFARLLRHGSVSVVPGAESTEAYLCELFGIAPTHPFDLPTAALARYSETGKRDGHNWMFSHPVHLRPERNGVMLFDESMLGIDGEESASILSTLNSLFDGEILFDATHPSAWYARINETPKMRTTPLAQVAGRNITGYLPEGPDAREWNLVSNEIQMALHNHPVNLVRTERGVPEINAVWFTGAGRLPKTADSSCTHVWTENPVLMALANLSGTRRSDVPLTAGRWLEQESLTGRHLIVLDLERDLGGVPDSAENWTRLMGIFEERWVEPLERALRLRRLQSLKIDSVSEGSYTVTQAELGRMRRWMNLGRRFFSSL